MGKQMDIFDKTIKSNSEKATKEGIRIIENGSDDFLVNVNDLQEKSDISSAMANDISLSTGVYRKYVPISEVRTYLENKCKNSDRVVRQVGKENRELNNLFFSIRNISRKIEDERIDDTITHCVTSIGLVGIINKFRKEECNDEELTHEEMFTTIRNEREDLIRTGVSKKNVVLSSGDNEDAHYYKLSKNGVMYFLSRESTVVRFRTMHYIYKHCVNISNRDKLMLSAINAKSEEARIGALEELEKFLLATEKTVGSSSNDKTAVGYKLIDKAADVEDKINKTGLDDESLNYLLGNFDGTFTLTDASLRINNMLDSNSKIGRDNFIAMLRALGILQKDNSPYRNYIKYFVIKTITVKNKNNSRIHLQTLIRESGVLMIAKIVKGLSKEKIDELIKLGKKDEIEKGSNYKV